MSCWLVIPVKPPGQAKSRLSEVLDSSQRAALARAMLARVLQAAQGAHGIAQVALLGPSRLGAAEDVMLLADPGGGLNPAIHSAFDHAASQGASRCIILFADLPQLTSDDVDRLVSLAPDELGIAPDRHRSGSNALSLPLPAGKAFTFAFGPDSFAAHKAEAGRLGLRIEEVASPGLSRDIDTPQDLADAAGLTGEEGQWIPAQST